MIKVGLDTPFICISNLYLSLVSHNPRARARIRFLVAFFARGVPGIFASFLFYLVKNTRAVVAVVAAAGKKSVVFEEFAYFYATIKL